MIMCASCSCATILWTKFELGFVTIDAFFVGLVFFPVKVDKMVELFDKVELGLGAALEALIVLPS